MDDRTLQRKLNQFVKLGMELDAEAKRRYGEDGFLFHEADGNVVIMDGDTDDVSAERQKHIRHAAKGYAGWGSGAW